MKLIQAGSRRALTFILLTVALAHGAADARVNQDTGKLYGVVVDWQYALVMDATIFFEGEGITKKVSVNDNGEYEVDLPVGTYSVRAVRVGFLPRRFQFKVEAGATKKLSMILDVDTRLMIVKCPKGRLCL